MILTKTEAGAGPPIALMHGLFGMGRNLGVVQRRLAVRYRVLAIDLRNHGASPHDPVMDYPSLAADVIETLGAAKALPACLLGHSMGGKTAMMAALTSPDLVERLIVADIAPISYPSHFGGFVQAMRDMPAGLSRPAADSRLASAVHDPAVRAFLLQNYRADAQPPWRIGLEEIARTLPILEAWPSLPPSSVYRGPALFLRGARSDYVPEGAVGEITTRFPAAEIVTIAEAGHWLHAEQPDAFVTAVEAFLSA